MVHLALLISFTILSFLCYSNAQQCDHTSPLARFDCYPEKDPTKEKCLARNCCWKLLLEQTNYTKKQSTKNTLGLNAAPFCFYPTDFPTYVVTSNETTDFGQRIRIVKSQTTYMPHDILNLTVDLIYETEQRFRIRIYDSVYQRYEVPLQVPVVEKKADMTDYEVKFSGEPFAIVVTRKSTGVIL
jgi:hypothetical protein